jgi:hypothetical protein
MRAPRLAIRSVEVQQRLMPFTRPFRFGAVVVREAPQAFVRVEIEVEGFGRAAGVSAEMMMPKWFDKTPGKTPTQTSADLRDCLDQAATLYQGRRGFDTAFGHHAVAYRAQCGWAEEEDLPVLAASFGPALIDKAVLDALLGALDINLIKGLCLNVPGLDARLTPSLENEAITDFLARLSPVPQVAIRHTIGILDQLEGPGGLADEIAAARLRFFKIKIGGDLPADLDRLRAITQILGRQAPDFMATLDANEQYDPDRLEALIATLSADPILQKLRGRLLHIEQPFDRRATFAQPLSPAARTIPIIIDEADDAYDAFPLAADLGYRGVSSKSCKGIYKALLNAARVTLWNRQAGEARFLISGEDLTCQAGLAVQQDTALIAALGLGHVERNGHHYVDGFGPAPHTEAQAYLKAHPALYRVHEDAICLDTRSGFLATASLFAGSGFASAGAAGTVGLLQRLIL